MSSIKELTQTVRRTKDELRKLKEENKKLSTRLKIAIDYANGDVLHFQSSNPQVKVNCTDCGRPIELDHYLTRLHNEMIAVMDDGLKQIKLRWKG